MKGLSIPIMALLLTACGHWQSGPDAPFVRWKCQGQQHIAWRYANADRTAIDLKVGDSERIHSLKKEPATRGSFYSDGVLAFHDKGNEALVYRVADDELLAHGCSASLINL
ncbi:MliC family protein [Pseudomonas lopnurensis]|uniref:MliC family protein n=1 Tax=Pseudomonas lopnurensis TaxID=1477517 RepID=UPI00187AC9EF|nr:MliC family protein [Pseudomonas lopnurensis]MBE7374386.1 MliC family protein [Pseudomonas lopnurensis]